MTGRSVASFAIALVFATLLGGAFGSFAGVVATRGWRASLSGRSHCDSCGRSLSWFDLIPLVSFFALRARCRSCGASFGWHPLVWELGGAAVTLAIVVPLLLALGV
jgi:leader peptidase (prepilin peptidase) / N-methyltransferase